MKMRIPRRERLGRLEEKDEKRRKELTKVIEEPER